MKQAPRLPSQPAAGRPIVLREPGSGDPPEIDDVTTATLEGQSLQDVVARAQRDGGLETNVYLRVLVEVCAELHRLHERRGEGGYPLGLVHRDVGPHNVFITYDGRVRVLDVVVMEEQLAGVQARKGMPLGDVAYMAPEQARGALWDRRADVFAVGVMVWEAATGSRMWGGLSEFEIHRALARAEIPSVELANPDVPWELGHVCSRALAWDPQDRFPTAADLALALHHYLAAVGPVPSLADIGERVARGFADESAPDVQMTTAAPPRRVAPVPGGWLRGGGFLQIAIALALTAVLAFVLRPTPGTAPSAALRTAPTASGSASVVAPAPASAPATTLAPPSASAPATALAPPSASALTVASAPAAPSTATLAVRAPARPDGARAHPRATVRRPLQAAPSAAARQSRPIDVFDPYTE